VAETSRRTFIKSGVHATAALVLGFRMPVCADGWPERSAGEARVFVPNAWLRIGSDDRVTILVEKPELGQGSRTYTAMMVAEELEADWSTIRVEQAPTIPSVYQELRTGGSGGVESTFVPMRHVGAQAREMLLAAAALRWRVSKGECRPQNGRIAHRPTGRSLTYGALAVAASRLPPLRLEDIRLKDPANFRFIGKPIPRLDVPSKVDGSAVFGIDVRVPGMLFAVIARCPVFGGVLQHVDSAAARAVPGVRAVFPVPALPRRFNTAGGVAVVADSTWTAITARRLLKLDWNGGHGSEESTDRLRVALAERAAGPPTYVMVDRGDTAESLRGAWRVISASYESPFQAHATMEPMNTTVQVRDDAIEVWSPTQFAAEAQSEIAELSQRPAHGVVVHMMLSGGSFGRRYQWDYAAEAWQVADAMKPHPVQLLWTREDDMQHDFYRPYNYQRLEGGLDRQGRVTAWSTRVVTTPISGTNLYTGYVESPESLRDPATVAALEWYGADVAPYDIANVRLDYAPVDSLVPRSWWRSVASSYTLFAKECFVDELAHAAGRDPLAFRLAMLPETSIEASRVRAVLQRAATGAGWGRRLPRGHGLGIACRGGDTCNAQVAEVVVAADGTVRVVRVVSAIDCGIAVNPDSVRAMTEGAINFALTAVLHADITVHHGVVDQSNFHDYRVLRLSEAPAIDVHIVPSTRDPSGVGELGVMLAGPAVANAVCAATGVRVRRLPIDPKLLRRS
jgi:isoquinoline 1-oxidoreductase beta subunit